MIHKLAGIYIGQRGELISNQDEICIFDIASAVDMATVKKITVEEILCESEGQ